MAENFWGEITAIQVYEAQRFPKQIQLKEMFAQTHCNQDFKTIKEKKNSESSKRKKDSLYTKES